MSATLACPSCGTRYPVVDLACSACGTPSPALGGGETSALGTLASDLSAGDGPSGSTLVADALSADLDDDSDLEEPDYFEPLTIGRAADCEHVIADPGISGHHARLVKDPDGIHLEDLDSANGTFVDGRRIKRVVLGWAQPFTVANYTLTPRALVAQSRARRLSTATSVVTALTDLGPELATTRKGGRSANLGPASGSRNRVSVPAAPAFRSEWAIGQALVVGRDASCDIVIDTPNVSRYHCRLERRPDGILVSDMGSTNGTWTGGERLTRPVLVEQGADVYVGPHRLDLVFDLNSVKQRAAQAGVTGVRLDAQNLVRLVGSPAKPMTVVDHVSFSILPGEMVAIMGPSGAGKTSVLTTIAGYTPPSSGGVFLDGLSLYRHYDVFRRAIGYVPQEDVMHRVLTVEEVLYYHARIHFPGEMTDAEIHSRIDTVLEQLDLRHVRTSLIGDEVRRGLSGGQRKRVNVAMELLSQPSLLVLDEPTSGLDARSAYQLIRICRDLASVGRTIVMTIHQPRREAFELFDKLLLLTTGGKLAYFGPTTECKRYFQVSSEVPPESAQNPADYALDVLDPVDPAFARPKEHWEEQYKKSPEFRRFVSARQKKEDLKSARKAAKAGAPSRANPWRQAHTLIRRYALLKWRDRSALAVQVAQAPVIAALAIILFYQGRFEPIRQQDDITPSLFILAAGAVWFGCSNVAREIVGEKAIFRRERMGSLRAGPYLASKAIVQGGIILLQMAILLALVVPVVGLTGSLPSLLFVPLLAGWSSMALGLLISTIARTELQAIQYVPLAVLPQIMLSGILVPVAGEQATQTASWLSQPILLRWAYGAFLKVEYAASSLHGRKLWKDADGLEMSHIGKEFWRRIGFGADDLAQNIGIIGGLGLGCLLLSWSMLYRRDRP